MKRGNVPAPWEVPSLAGRSARMEGELWSLGGECSNRVCGRQNGETCTDGWCCCAALLSLRHILLGGWRLGAKAQASEVRPGEGAGVDCEGWPKEVRVWCSYNQGCMWKKPGPAIQMKCHFLGDA